MTKRDLLKETVDDLWQKKHLDLLKAGWISVISIKAKNLKVGDKVDLSSCPHLQIEVCELARIDKVEHNPSYSIIYYDGIAEGIKYNPDQELDIERN